ncbi:MAG: endonuclease domain-containing protein [Bacteroidetes bacterium]|nr:endonuclease domain-containing protein [Bacteroidota bacterium]
MARKLRQSTTYSERLLWRGLRRKQILGYDFDRQRPIDRFVVDFYCKDLKLAIEIDGISHAGDEAQTKDRERQARLEELGVRFLRFADDEVRENADGVLESIRQWILNNGVSSTHPLSPSNRRGHVRPPRRGRGDRGAG